MRTKKILNPQEIFSTALKNSNSCLLCQPNKGMAIHETENFYILRDNFPIASGHLMISSKRHFGSLGELDQCLISELQTIKDRIQLLFRLSFGSVIFYEHGRVGSCHATDTDGLNCEHFHLHCLPLNICIHKDIVLHLSKHFFVHNLSEIADLFEKWGEYLYFENNQGQAVYYPALATTIPPHFLRTLVCRAIGNPHKANWQKHQVFEDFIDNFETIKKITPQLISAQRKIAHTNDLF